MLHSLGLWLQSVDPEHFGFLRVFQYITFRAVMAAMTALLIGLAFGPWVINRLAEMKIGQPIREYGVKEHIAKSGTPTMGGVLILIGIGVSTLLWFDWSNRFVWIVLIVTLGFGAIGWGDDWRKGGQKNPGGMPAREKDFWQSVIGPMAALDLAVRVAGSYLLLPYIPGAGELLIFCGAMAGAGLAFLWFNAHPAQVFMGDVGALALGGALGTIAVIVRQEILLGIMGGIFVVEALSVMAQVSWFKYTKKRFGEGRRLFKMAPLHHHFEKSGWKETQVVVRFWIITMLLCLVGLSTLKLR